MCRLLSTPTSSHCSTCAFILHFPPLPSSTALAHSCSSRGAVADAWELGLEALMPQWTTKHSGDLLVLQPDQLPTVQVLHPLWIFTFSRSLMSQTTRF